MRWVKNLYFTHPGREPNGRLAYYVARSASVKHRAAYPKDKRSLK
jgi:hypothetical protein